MSETLVKTGLVEVAGQSYPVRYYRWTTSRGRHRYSSEVVLEAGDCVILDDDSLGALEARLANLVPASVYSRRLWTKGREAA